MLGALHEKEEIGAYLYIKVFSHTPSTPLAVVKFLFRGRKKEATLLFPTAHGSFSFTSTRRGGRKEKKNIIKAKTLVKEEDVLHGSKES